MDKGYHLGRLDLGLFSLLSMCPYHSSFIPFRTQSMLEISKLFDCKGKLYAPNIVWNSRQICFLRGVVIVCHIHKQRIVEFKWNRKPLTPSYELFDESTIMAIILWTFFSLDKILE